MIPKVKPSLWETNSGNAGSVASATLSKKRQKIVETVVYKISDNRSLPYRSRPSRAAARAAKEGAGDRAAGSPAPAAILSQYDSSDDGAGDEGANYNGVDVKVVDEDDGLNEEELVKEGTGARTDGVEYARPKEDGEAAQANATNGKAKVNEATDVKIREDGSAGEGRDGLCHHSMAELEAAMAVPGSTATHFAE
jgi:hypothetical protein